VDIVVARAVEQGQPTKTVSADALPDDHAGVDIGEKTRDDMAKLIAQAKTIVWNGPMGVFEIDEFSKGTKDIAHAVTNATASGAISIVGGGDTIAALRKFGLVDKVSHASTGGGASLEYLEGKELPGIKILKDKK
jgi:3-phosphoglycerate kinase